MRFFSHYGKELRAVKFQLKAGILNEKDENYTYDQL